MSLAKISRALSRAVEALEPGDAVAYTYNPLEYARIPHERYLEKWGASRKQVVLLGMNPGPFGMAQTGVPFGDVKLVREFLEIDGPVGHPPREHDKRPVLGFDCQRREVSGSRLWGWARDRFETPENFFARFFVVNYCPLVFMTETGKNLTPDKLPASVAAPLFAACDEALRAVVRDLQPEWLIGVGAFAAKQAKHALSRERGDVGQGAGPRIASILHPSPASPRANRGWAPQATAQLEQLGIL